MFRKKLQEQTLQETCSKIAEARQVCITGEEVAGAHVKWSKPSDEMRNNTTGGEGRESQRERGGGEAEKGHNKKRNRDIQQLQRGQERHT